MARELLLRASRPQDIGGNFFPGGWTKRELLVVKTDCATSIKLAKSYQWLLIDGTIDIQ